MTTLILVRHGETDWNRDRRIQGRTDIPLNDTGRAQARETAKRLGEEVGGRAPVIVSSDLSRARETAELIADGLGAPLSRAYPDLRERAYGEAEGIETSDFRLLWGDSYTAEIPGAESTDALRHRAIRALRSVVRDARRDAAPADVIIVVTHGALIREVIRHATAGELPPVGERLPNGSSSTFFVEGERLTMRTYAGAAPV